MEKRGDSVTHMPHNTLQQSSQNINVLEEEKGAAVCVDSDIRRETLCMGPNMGEDLTPLWGLPFYTARNGCEEGKRLSLPTEHFSKINLCPLDSRSALRKTAHVNHAAASIQATSLLLLAYRSSLCWILKTHKSSCLLTMSKLTGCPTSSMKVALSSILHCEVRGTDWKEGNWGTFLWSPCCLHPQHLPMFVLDSRRNA